MMATARRNSAAASAGRPARCRARPTYEWLMASLFWKSVSVGYSSASLCRIARARSYDASASAGWPV